jgi:hypothetical protein
MRIYIAHSIENMKWVKETIFPKLDRFEIEDPFDSQRHILEGRSESEIRNKPNISKLFPAKWVVDHDISQMDRVDGMLVIRDGGDAYGSIFELVYMAVVRKKPVAFVDLRGPPIYHPWLYHHCICVTDDIDIAINSLTMFFDFESEVHIKEEQ